MTNEAAEHAVLSEEDYGRFLAGGVKAEEPLGRELLAKGFLRRHLDFAGLARRCVEKNLLAWPGPRVHTIVATLRCNFRCLYCHASVVGAGDVSKDMTLETAKKVVDFIFQSPNPELMVEFQGGEPLLNWPVVKFIARYARRKARLEGRKLHIGLISNFSLLDGEMIEELIAQKVSFCTSLDGPEALHNKNRLFAGGNSHAEAVANIRRVQARRAAGADVDAPNAIATVTRFSLSQPREIVDQFVELGLERVQLGPLDPIGFAKKSWGVIGYSSAEYLGFYRQALERVIELSREGVKVYEKMAMILLLRILRGGHWRFPNGDGVCRLAYDFDGSIFPSEEGRLVANEGDDFFKLGHVGESTYEELLGRPALRAGLMAASSNSQPMCFQCAYNPYCTVVPVYNYQTQDSPWGQMPSNGWCEKMMGIFDLLFEKLADPGSRKVLESWLEFSER